MYADMYCSAEETYTISRSQVKDLGLIARRYTSGAEQVLLKEACQGVEAAKPLVSGILIVRRFVSAIPVIGARERLVFFQSHEAEGTAKCVMMEQPKRFPRPEPKSGGADVWSGGTDRIGMASHG